MSHPRFNKVLSVALLSVSGGLLLHNFLHTRYSEFTAGLLIGISIVFLIAGLVKREPASFNQ